MSSIGLLIIILAGIAAYYGWRTGLIAQLGRVVGFFAALIACNIFASGVVDILDSRLEPASQNEFESHLLNLVIGYVITFAVVYCIVSFLARGLSNLAHHLMLGLPDRIGGVIFTILEWLVGASLLLNLWAAIYPRSGVGRDSKGVENVTLNLAPTLTGSETIREAYSGASNWRPDSDEPSENSQHRDSVINTDRALDEFVGTDNTERKVIDYTRKNRQKKSE